VKARALAKDVSEYSEDYLAKIILAWNTSREQEQMEVRGTRSGLLISERLSCVP